MINKVEKLISIGKFRNYQAAGKVNFNKLTLIYGDNGGGKTTLTSVFRSLKLNKPEIIESRISTNHTTPQAAQISQKETSIIYHTFRKAGWSISFPEIEIFDIHFINDNIYSGFDFTDDKKRQLHQFVIGAQGVAIQNQIEKNKADKVNLRQSQEELENQLIQKVGNNLTTSMINDFLSTPKTLTNGLDELIFEAETGLASANANSLIQTLLPLSLISPINSLIDFAAIIKDLQLTLDSIQNQTLESLFTSHCQDLTQNLIDDPEAWIQKGFVYVEKKKILNEFPISCPFCQQEIDEKADLLNSYISKFNKDFNELVKRIQLYSNSIEKFNIESVFQSIKTLSQINSDRILSWSTYLLDKTKPEKISIIFDEEKIRIQYQELVSLLNLKLSNPTNSIVVDPVLSFETFIGELNTKIEVYNQEVILYNKTISDFRLTIKSTEVAQLQLDRLRRIKARFEPTVDLLCSKAIEDRKNLRELEGAYTQLVQQQEKEATIFFSDYQKKINYYLGSDVFKTNFKVEDVVHIAPQGRAIQSKISYKLTIDGKDISFDSSQPLSVKESLSEGDKTTIALAFFLSKLDIDPNRADKILIFDDPLSSLDTNRRNYTIRIIKSLFHQIRQVIVLSHNEYFLFEVGKDIAASLKSTLRISVDFKSNASKIEECDLNELVKIEYFKQLEALEDFRSNPDLSLKEVVLGWLRNVLEAHLRFKFYKEARSLAGVHTLGNLIRHLDNYPVVFRDDKNRKKIISQLHLVNDVSWKSHHGDPNPDYSLLGMNPNSMTAVELDNLIQDTLHLIEVQI
jgi:wobble nucleotide-excising tRNase